MDTFEKLVGLVKSEMGLGPNSGTCDEFIWRMAREHKVAAILAPKILDPNAPASLVDEARYVWHMGALRQEYYLKKCEEVISLLDEKGIAARILKGAELAKSYYPRPGFRAFRDLDLLLQPSDVAKAHPTLLHAGFLELKPKGPLPRAVETKGDVLAATFAGLDAVSYQRDDLFLEVHTRFLPPLLGEYPLDSVWNRAGAVSPEDTFIHLCFHTTRHHFLSGLRHLIDIALVARRISSFEAVERKLRGADLMWLAWPAWKLASEMFPEAVKEPPMCEMKMLSFYTGTVRNHLPDMPRKSIALAGSPLPFVWMKGGWFKALKGSSELKKYQLGENTTSLRKGSWVLQRPFVLAWRHTPVIWNWLKFTVSSFV